MELPFELVAPPVVEGPAPDEVRACAATTRGVVDLVERLPDEWGRRVRYAVGGGRVMVDAAEDAARTGAPWVAVPTTYAPAWAAVRPRPSQVLLDPALPAALPDELRRASLAAARATAVEALWAPDSTPSVRWVATSALRTLSRPAADDAALLHAAALAAVGSANCAPGLLSALARVLDRHGVPYATAVAALLPRVARWVGAPAYDALATVADVARTDATRDAALAALAPASPLPPPDDATVDAVVAELAATAYLSPRPPTAGDLRELLRPAE